MKINRHAILLSTSAKEINFSLGVVNYEKTWLYNWIESDFNFNKNKK